MRVRKTELGGQRFGRLLVGNFVRKGKYVYWECICDCGTVKSVLSSNLTNGSTQSCGCLLKLNGRFTRTHGKSTSRSYHKWSGMLTRCYSENSGSYPDYGGRGIRVCRRWHKFESFYSDMGDPKPSMTLERIDNNGNYSPENCRWATRREQSRNRRSIKFLDFNGERKPLWQWTKKLKIPYSTIQTRLRNGWSVDRALGTPRGKAWDSNFRHQQ